VERKRLIQILTPLAVACRQELDAAQWRVYYAALSDVSESVLASAVVTLIKGDTAFLPRPGEIRKAAEGVRQALLAAHPYEPCEGCSASPGWSEILVDGVKRLTRCGCRQAHIAKLEQLGVTSTPLALPPKDWTQQEDRA
jgi:hypothetical protein